MHNTAPTAVQGVRLGPKMTPFLVSGDTRGDLVLWELRYSTLPNKKMQKRIVKRTLISSEYLILFRHGKNIRTIKQGHEGAVTNFAWGGTRLVSSGCDAVVKLWDVEKGIFFFFFPLLPMVTFD